MMNTDCHSVSKNQDFEPGSEGRGRLRSLLGIIDQGASDRFFDTACLSSLRLLVRKYPTIVMAAIIVNKQQMNLPRSLEQLKVFFRLSMFL